MKNLDPGNVTQTTEALNTTFSPGIFKWLKPSFTYNANYRWTNDLSREGQNISSQLKDLDQISPFRQYNCLNSFINLPSKSRGRSNNSRSRSRTRSRVPEKTIKKTLGKSKRKQITKFHSWNDK